MRKEVTQEELDNFLDKILKYNPKKEKKSKHIEKVEDSVSRQNQQKANRPDET